MPLRAMKRRTTASAVTIPGCSSPRTHSRSQGPPLRRIRGQTPLHSSLGNSYSERSSIDSAESQLPVPVPSNCMIDVVLGTNFLGRYDCDAFYAEVAYWQKKQITNQWPLHLSWSILSTCWPWIVVFKMWTLNLQLYAVWILTTECELYLLVCKCNVYAYIFGACSLFGGPLAMLMFDLT